MKLNFLLFIIIYSLCSLIGGFLWPYTINTWLIFFDKDPSILFWHGLLLGLCPIVGQVTIPVAVVTWILMLFLV